MDSNAFLNDLMSKMKLPEAKGKKKAEQSESVAQILAAMQKVKTEKKKPPVTSYAPTKEMPVNELESMEEFSQLASDVMQECRPAIPAVKTSISEKTVRVAAYIRVSSTNPAQEDSYEMQELYVTPGRKCRVDIRRHLFRSWHFRNKQGRTDRFQPFAPALQAGEN